MILCELRQGFGLDIEFNESICYVADTNDVENGLFAFVGVIILLPFIKIHIGDMNLIGGAKA